MDKLTTQLTALSTVVYSMQDTLTNLPHQLEQLVMAVSAKNIPAVSSTSPTDSPQPKSVLPIPLQPKPTTTTPPPFVPPLIHDNYFESSLFSLPNVKLPQFDGIDPQGWITKAELYFQVNKIPVTQKLQLAQMCMDGVALNWYTNLLIKHPSTDWLHFRDKMMVRFSGSKFQNAHEVLGSLFQEGSIDDYIEEFEALSALIPDQSEEQSIGMFLRGLKPDVRNWVRALNPHSCDQAMEFARHVAIATGGTSEKKNRPRTGPGSYSPSGALSWKGAHQRTDFSQPTLQQRPTTTGEIHGFPAIILVDSRATHNFISKKLATALGIELHAVGPLGIRLGDGNRVWVTHQCRQVSLKFGSFTCAVDALTHEIKFWQHGEQIRQHGINSPLLSQTSIRTCLENHLVGLSVDSTEPSQLSPPQQQQLAELLSRFTTLFQNPQGLPPQALN
ncbi:hypothetical protein LXL04_018121 [Taraxacum kok-saghyz]